MALADRAQGGWRVAAARSWMRRRTLLCALALALVGHAWLLSTLSSTAQRVAGAARGDDARRRARVVVVELSVRPADATRTPSLDELSDAEPAGRLGAPPASQTPTPAAGARRGAHAADTARPDRARRPQPAAHAGPAAPSEDAGRLEASRAAGVDTTDTTDTTDAIDAIDAIDAASLPASPPAAATLRWRVDDRGRTGQARLEWRPDADGEYAATLSVRLDGQPVAALEQRSDGRLDAAGLRPMRFTDRRGGRAARAATFVDDPTLGPVGARSVSFSSVEGLRDAPAGAQDRLGALVQLVALRRAGALPAAIEHTVVDTRGAARWRWQRLGGSAGDGDRALQHWRREPEHPDGMRVEVWLDPRAGHWPRRIRYSFLRGGDAVEYTLLDIEEDSPAARPATPADPSSSAPGT